MAKGLYKDWIQGDNLIRLQAWARDGLTDIDIAHNIGITTTTLYEWKKKYPLFAETLQYNKEIADILVENALFKRAVGYVADEITLERNSDGEMVEVKTVKKIIYPDVTAQKFWLVNRQAKKWREKPEIENDDALERLRLVVGMFDGAVKRQSND